MTTPKDQPKPTCEYAGETGDCTGPVAAHECVYTKEIFPGDAEMRKVCHCCRYCAWECGENI